MSETKTTGTRTAGKTEPARDAKRGRATRRLFCCLVICLVVWAGVYVAQATGHMSTWLAQRLAAITLTAGAFQVGSWKQFMWPEEG